MTPSQQPGFNIDWSTIATISIPALVVISGWFIGHLLNARRDLRLRKREARLKSLEAAYIRIATSSNRELTDKLKDDLEMFVAEIQLYGTPRQIELMVEIVEGFKKPNNKVSYDAILADLRNSIRRELNLEPVSGEVWWLRFSRAGTETKSDPPPKKA
jgi:hypothetical protein